MTRSEAKRNASKKAKAKRAAAWPAYEVDHARAELAAMRLMVAGAPLDHVQQTTRLSWDHTRRLADLVAEEADNPHTPRNVVRDPLPDRPARIHVATV